METQRQWQLWQNKNKKDEGLNWQHGGDSDKRRRVEKEEGTRKDIGKKPKKELEMPMFSFEHNDSTTYQDFQY